LIKPRPVEINGKRCTMILQNAMDARDYRRVAKTGSKSISESRSMRKWLGKM